MPIPFPDPATVQGFLEAHYRRPRPPGSLRWLGWPGTWDPTLGGVAQPIERVDTGGFFRRHVIFRVHVRGRSLPCTAGPGLGSFGLFSFDGATIRPLCAAAPAGFEETLRAEARPLAEADPARMASLFCRAWLDHAAWSHVVIADPDDLIRSGHDAFDRVDPAELDRVGPWIQPPSISVQAPPGGWRLDFTTVFRWRHERQGLSRESFDIDAGFHVARAAPIVLSTKLFFEGPGLTD